MDIFQNSMVLFWILVQQICLCFIKWAYEDLRERPFAVLRYGAVQGIFFFLFFLLAFDTLFGLDFVYSRFPEKAFFFYPRIRWNFFCTVMLILDALLVAYGWRIYRLYMANFPRMQSAETVFMQNFVLVAAFLILFFAYHAGMTRAALRYDFSQESVWATQFFFIKIANFFYAVFEGIGAAMLWKMYRKMRGEAFLFARS